MVLPVIKNKLKEDGESLKVLQKAFDDLQRTQKYLKKEDDLFQDRLQHVKILRAIEKMNISTVTYIFLQYILILQILKIW